MVWVDRVGVFWLVLVWSVIALLSKIQFGSVADAFTYPGVLNPLIYGGIPWVILRGLYWVATGRITEPE